MESREFIQQKYLLNHFGEGNPERVRPTQKPEGLVKYQRRGRSDGPVVGRAAL